MTIRQELETAETLASSDQETDPVPKNLEDVNRDASRSVEKGEEKSPNGVLESLVPENGAEHGGTSGKMINSAPESGEKEGERSDSDNVGAARGEENSEGVGYLGHAHGYSVGDYVWGKIKSHPWWPGRIYDPSDASEFALKYQQTGRLLVAYFGDGSFAWCLPSQLVPFVERFEEMSRQSSSKGFVNAVEKAKDEISQLVELELTCSCIQQTEATRPVTVNAGIKAGVLAPKISVGSIPLVSEGTEILESFRNFSRNVLRGSMLEIMVLNSWLSAFYRSKWGYAMPRFHEPVLVEGLEDKSENNVIENDFSVPITVPIQGPEEDWPDDAGKLDGFSEDKLYHGRKQKSVSELMREDNALEHEDKKRTVEGSQSRKPTSEKKNKISDEDAGNKRQGRRKKSEASMSTKAADDGPNLMGENDTGKRKREANENPLLSELKKRKLSSIQKEESEKDNMSRERKKSKYLSPPYTNLRWKSGKSSSQKELEMESERISKIANVGQRVSRAATQLLRLPGKSERVEEENLESVENSQKAERINQHTDNEAVDLPVNELMSKIRSNAVNPLLRRRKKDHDRVRGFVSAFKSSTCLQGSNYKTYRKMRADTKKSKRNSQRETKSAKNMSKKKEEEEAEQAGYDKPSPLFGEIRQNLETVVSMVGKCDGRVSFEEKSYLHGQVRSLLKKVSGMSTI